MTVREFHAIESPMRNKIKYQVISRYNCSVAFARRDEIPRSSLALV